MSKFLFKNFYTLFFIFSLVGADVAQEFSAKESLALLRKIKELPTDLVGQVAISYRAAERALVPLTFVGHNVYAQMQKTYSKRPQYRIEFRANNELFVTDKKTGQEKKILDAHVLTLRGPNGNGFLLTAISRKPKYSSVANFSNREIVFSDVSLTEEISDTHLLELHPHDSRWLLEEFTATHSGVSIKQQMLIGDQIHTFESANVKIIECRYDYDDYAFYVAHLFRDWLHFQENEDAYESFPDVSFGSLCMVGNNSVLVGLRDRIQLFSSDGQKTGEILSAKLIAEIPKEMIAEHPQYAKKIQEKLLAQDFEELDNSILEKSSYDFSRVSILKLSEQFVYGERTYYSVAVAPRFIFSADASQSLICAHVYSSKNQDFPVYSFLIDISGNNVAYIRTMPQEENGLRAFNKLEVGKPFAGFLYEMRPHTDAIEDQIQYGMVPVDSKDQDFAYVLLASAAHKLLANKGSKAARKKQFDYVTGAEILRALHNRNVVPNRHYLLARTPKLFKKLYNVTRAVIVAKAAEIAEQSTSVFDVHKARELLDMVYDPAVFSNSAHRIKLLQHTAVVALQKRN